MKPNKNLTANFNPKFTGYSSVIDLEMCADSQILVRQRLATLTITKLTD